MQYSTNLLMKKPEWSDDTDILANLLFNWDILDGIVHAANIHAIWKEIFTDVAAASMTAIHAATAGTGAIQNIAAGITNPGDGRNVTVTATNVASPSGSIVITGLVRGTEDTESIPIGAGTTVAGNKPFNTVTNIQLPAGLSASDTVSVGIGDKFGLLHEIDAISNVYMISVNTVELTSTYAALVNATYSTIDFSTVGVYQDMVVCYYQIE